MAFVFICVHFLVYPGVTACNVSVSFVESSISNLQTSRRFLTVEARMCDLSIVPQLCTKVPSKHDKTMLRFN